ncbi:hypothetical protein [Bradyrhizobium sp. USDA 4529]
MSYGLVLSLLCMPLCGGAIAQHAGRADVLTMHADRQRTGWFSHAGELTPAALETGRFGKLWQSPQLDGFGTYPARLYASPLYVDGLAIKTAEHNGIFRVVIAATSTGYVYAINAAEANGVAPGAILWKARLDTPPCMLPWDASAMGILGTPVIDKARKHLYVANCAAQASFKIYALDLSTGAVHDGWPVAIDEDTLGQPSINRNPRYANAPPPPPAQPGRVWIQRGALNLSPDDRYLYATIGAGRGWVLAVDTQRKAIASAFSVTPLAEDRSGGVWASTGVSIDARGDVYAVTGASVHLKHATAVRHWAQSVLRFSPLSPSARELTLQGIYTPFNYCRTEVADIDLGSSGTVILPAAGGQTITSDPLLAVAGKQGNAYLLGSSSFATPDEERRSCSDDSESDRSLLAPEPQPQFGKRGPINIFGPYSDSDGMVDHAKNRATPTYFRDGAGDEYLFFVGNTKDPADTRVSVAPSLVRLQLIRPRGADPYLRIDGQATDFVLQNPGLAVVSSNGGADAIVWVLDENASRTAPLTGPKAPSPVLYAIDSKTLKVLWKTDPGSLQTSGKYNEPTIARGTVFVGTDRIVAFGLKPALAAEGTTQPLAAAQRAMPLATAVRGTTPPDAADHVQPPSELPPGPGRDLTAKTCQECHAVEIITRRRLNSADWRDLVDAMVKFGAQADEKQKAEIGEYLSRNFPPADAPGKPATVKTP